MATTGDAGGTPEPRERWCCWLDVLGFSCKVLRGGEGKVRAIVAVRGVLAALLRIGALAFSDEFDYEWLKAHPEDYPLYGHPEDHRPRGGIICHQLVDGVLVTPLDWDVPLATGVAAVTVVVRHTATEEPWLPSRAAFARGETASQAEFTADFLVERALPEAVPADQDGGMRRRSTKVTVDGKRLSAEHDFVTLEGRVLMTLTQSTGEGPVRAYENARSGSRAPSGPLLLVPDDEAAGLEEVSEWLRPVCGRSDLLSLDWVHVQWPLARQMAHDAGLRWPDAGELETRLRDYLDEQSPELAGKWEAALELLAVPGAA